jgi:hypothetical protein
LMRLYRRDTVDKLVTTHLDETRWRYELAYRSYFAHVYCLTDHQGQVVGSYVASAEVWGGEVAIWQVVVDKGIALRTALPTIVRAVKAHGKRQLKGTKDKEGQEKTLQNIRFILGARHPAYEAFDAKLGALQPPYGWYIRIPDLPGFIRHIAPALEKRLAGSVISGYSGELRITFYQGGLRLVFEQGRLTTAENWQSLDDRKDRGGAGFPPLVFLKLLFGYRSLEELRYAFPDCWAEEEPTLLLNALFPKQASWVVGLG